MSLFKSNPSPSQSVNVDPIQLKQEFVDLTQQLSEILKSQGILKKPFLEPSVPHFSALPQNKAEVITHHLRIIVEVYQECVASESKIDTKKALWRFFAKTGITPDATVMDKIESHNVVEIYNTEHISIFKNLVFFDKISMNIEEIFCLPWWELMSISKVGYLYFIEMGVRLASGSIRHGFVPWFHSYVFQELKGDLWKVSINIKWCAPVSYKKNRDCMLFVNEAKVL